MRLNVNFTHNLCQLPTGVPALEHLIIIRQDPLLRNTLHILSIQRSNNQTHKLTQLHPRYASKKEIKAKWKREHACSTGVLHLLFCSSIQFMNMFAVCMLKHELGCSCFVCIYEHTTTVVELKLICNETHRPRRRSDVHQQHDFCLKLLVSFV